MLDNSGNRDATERDFNWSFKLKLRRAGDPGCKFTRSVMLFAGRVNQQSLRVFVKLNDPSDR